jgi:hypothetical protein
MSVCNETIAGEFELADLLFEIEKNEELQESSIFKSFIEMIVIDNEESESMQNVSVTELNDGIFLLFLLYNLTLRK